MYVIQRDNKCISINVRVMSRYLVPIFILRFYLQRTCVSFHSPPHLKYILCYVYRLLQNIQPVMNNHILLNELIYDGRFSSFVSHSFFIPFQT